MIAISYLPARATILLQWPALTYAAHCVTIEHAFEREARGCGNWQLIHEEAVRGDGRDRDLAAWHGRLEYVLFAKAKDAVSGRDAIPYNAWRIASRHWSRMLSAADSSHMQIVVKIASMVRWRRSTMETTRFGRVDSPLKLRDSMQQNSGFTSDKFFTEPCETAWLGPGEILFQQNGIVHMVTEVDATARRVDWAVGCAATGACLLGRLVVI